MNSNSLKPSMIKSLPRDAFEDDSNIFESPLKGSSVTCRTQEICCHIKTELLVLSDH